MSWLPAFLLTLAVELPLVLLVAGGRRRRAAIDAVLANALTHPVAWLTIGSGSPWLLVEFAVAAAELGVYRGVTRLPWARAAAASLLANTVSASLSFFV